MFLRTQFTIESTTTRTTMTAKCLVTKTSSVRAIPKIGILLKLMINWNLYLKAAVGPDVELSEHLKRTIEDD